MAARHLPSVPEQIFPVSSIFNRSQSNSLKLCVLIVCGAAVNLVLSPFLGLATLLRVVTSLLFFLFHLDNWTSLFPLETCSTFDSAFTLSLSFSPCELVIFPLPAVLHAQDFLAAAAAAASGASSLTIPFSAFAFLFCVDNSSSLNGHNG